MKYANKGISLKVPIFLGALLLSMDNWKHDTFFMLYFKKKEKRKNYHCAVYIKAD